MRDFSLSKKFNLVTTPFRVFQHLQTPEDQLKCLKNIYNHLNPGGCVVIDIFNPSIPFLADTERNKEFDILRFYRADGTLVEQKERVSSIDFNKQLINAEEIYYLYKAGEKNPTRISSSYTVRYTFKEELSHLMRLAGFKDMETYGDYNFTPYGRQSYPGDILMLGFK